MVCWNEGERMKKARPDEKQCPICGKWFYPNRRLRKWCSAECRENGIKIQSEKHVYRKICPCCGKEFETNKQFQKYCCRACQKKSYTNPYLPDKYVIQGEAGLNRPLTADEIMHIHNWHAGGESVWQLAEELRRSEQSIQKALNTPLTPEQRRNNQKNPYTRGTTE